MASVGTNFVARTGLLGSTGVPVVLARKGEEPQRYLTEMNELLGTRYCDAAKMSSDDKFNDVKKNTLHFCVQGTFKAEGYERQHYPRIRLCLGARGRCARERCLTRQHL